MPKKPGKGRTLQAINTSTPVDAIRHKDTRVNIPTHELRDFVKEDEAAPKALLYPRDPSLDPQLVWKGKDDQDRHDLVVPAVPIYIQEKIHPQVLIENLRRESPKVDSDPELALFSDFNGIVEFDQKIDFYHHAGHWTNRLVLGDSLYVMTSLAEKEGLKGKVQCIYVDPPYGIRFGSNWQVSTRKRDVKDGSSEDATRQPEQVRAFRDTWRLGIHSYLAYLRDRLVVARELLTETGSVFVQIGEDNVHLVRAILDEVFGSEAFLGQIAFTKAGSGLDTTTRLSSRLDYLLWYGKDASRAKYRELFEERPAPTASGYDQVELASGERRRLTRDERDGNESLPPGARRYMTQVLTKPGPGAKYEVEFEGTQYGPGERWWGMPKPDLERVIRLGRVVAAGKTLRAIRYEDDFPVRTISNLWDGLGGASAPVYVVQTSPEVVKRCILMTTDPGDLVLDPTCGSGTTAYVAEQWGRRWITIDTSRVALALARTRLMSARLPYFLLADSPEGVTKEAELTGKVPPQGRTDNDVRKGFVYRRVPHVTLTSIAKNPDLKEGMAKTVFQEAVTRHADLEILLDSPYEDVKRVRVAGPFTVESLSPHRVLTTDEPQPRSEAEGQRESAAGQFETMIIDNLRRAGVQNTKRGERLVFDSLQPYAGTWIQATGEYRGSSGAVKRVAVSIGPELGTVGPLQVKEAAKEAIKLYDTLVVCGFAFDPHVSSEATKYGNLTILVTRMNPDLTMGDELLKKTGAGNLFMVFGEPDVDVRRLKDGKMVVEIKGLDVYDPTTGVIRSSSTDDIACWFIDTDYDEESFFVRHAYFTGADRPYEKLQRTLRTAIDENTWESLYRTVSRPFEVPATGKIAVKVVNHYGDEVLKVISTT